MADTTPNMLDPVVDLDRDHVLGSPDAEMTLVEYGSYACPPCHAVHGVIEELRSRFGERMRYVFRHLPVAGNEDATRAAELAEYAAHTTGRFWDVHETLMERGPVFAEGDIARIAAEFNLPLSDAMHEPAFAAAQARVRDDIESAQRSGVQVTPTFSSMAAAMRERGMKARSPTRCWPPGPSNPVCRLRVCSLGAIVGIAPGPRDDDRACAQQFVVRLSVRGVLGDALRFSVGQFRVRAFAAPLGQPRASHNFLLCRRTRNQA